MRFVIFPKLIISESFFVSNHFVSERMRRRLGKYSKTVGTLLLGRREAGPQKTGPGSDRSGLPPPPQNSVETLGFCRKVLWKVSHGEKKLLQDFGSQAKLFRPAPKRPSSDTFHIAPYL